MDVSAAQQAATDQVALNISIQPLAQALAELAVQADLKLVYYSELGDGLQAPALVGRFTPAAALRKLLADTPLHASFVDAHTVVIRADTAESHPSGRMISRGADGAVLTGNMNPTRLAGLSDITDVGTLGMSSDSNSSEYANDSNKKIEQVVVTGTHIRGAAPVGSPLTIYDRDTIDQTGAATIAEFAQTMTENFGSTTPVAFGYGNNSTGFDQTNNNSYNGSSFNLHGIGPGATLTLINGQRVSGGGNDGSFVDVSMIPLSAVERIEVLGDGGSAVYGADAVAGVVNIILKKTYDGAETSLRYSHPTGGGGQETTVSQLLGKSWQTGNLMGVYEYDHQAAIELAQRDFDLPEAYPGTIVPIDKRQSFLLNGRQQLFDEESSLDGSIFYGTRDNSSKYGGDYLLELASQTKQYGATVGVHRDFSGGWSAGINANASKTQESYTEAITQFSFSEQFSTNTQLREAALQADGPLFSLGVRPVKAAMGAGFRREQATSSAASANSELIRRVSYVYGELLLPFVDPSQSIPLVNKLELSVAGRYDHYDDFGSSTNPKVGFTWSPASAVTVRASYAKSFRPPLLTDLSPPPPKTQYYTQFEPNQNSPTGQTDTLLNDSSHNPNLSAEKATSYTGGLDFMPSFIPDFSVSTTYFRTDFKDRIARPPYIGNIFQGTANIFQQPALAPFINLSPDPSVIATIFNGPGFYGDLAGAGPGAVEALFNSGLTNIAETIQTGVEGSTTYKIDTKIGNVAFSMASTYFLQNKYLSTSTATPVSLLNLLGQPPRLRSRGGLSWTDKEWSSSLFANYTNSYKNPLFSPSEAIASWTTIDWQVTYRFADHLGFTDRSGIKVALSVQNLFDRDPPRVAYPPGTSDVGFDAVNASPFGRIVALQVTKAW
jgi:iron complex outermembrane receptor protein